jgi:short-subunit dehydrogenase
MPAAPGVREVTNEGTGSAVRGRTVPRILAGMPATISFARGAPSLDIVDVEGLREASQQAFDMVARGQGRILFTSSIAASMPGTYQAIYNASKSFVQSFALALRAELKDTGVTVTSLMPGPTDTEFFERADMLDTRIGAMDKDDPADVARDGFEALMAGEERVVSASLTTKLEAAGSRFLPDKAKAALHSRMSEPGSAKK